ncbi:DinB family protein [Ilyomonas limi]|nr:DinB family protein [Ilyomonas limi]
MQKTRINFVRLLDGLTTEQLNTIPTGLNNNLIWNFAHLLATQQVIFYRLSGLIPNLDEDFIKCYRRFSKPEAFVSAEEFEKIKQNFEQAQETFFEDYRMGAFTNFKRYTTSFGVQLDTLEDAIKFSSVHDGLHYGYAMAMKHLV